MTPKQQDLCQALCTDLWVVSRRQLLDNYAGGDGTAADRIVRPLIEAGRIRTFKVWALADMPDFTRPLAEGGPGTPRPDYWQLLYRADTRWAGQARMTTVYVATRCCAQLFGRHRTGALPHRLQGNHAVACSEVYYTLRRDQPAIAARWVGEDALPGLGSKVPDAGISDDSGQLARVIEVVGLHYGKEKLERLVEEALERGLGYAIY